MLRWIFGGTLWALFALEAQAQDVQLGFYDAINTRLGPVHVAKDADGYNDYVILNGRLPPLVQQAHATLRGAFGRGDQSHDWLIVETGHGGNMCPVSYVVLKLSAQAVTSSGEFGECLGILRLARVETDSFTMTFQDPDLRIDEQVFTFDGARLAKQASAAIYRVAPTLDLGKIAAMSGADALNDPGVQTALLQIMTLDVLEEVRQSTALGGQVRQQGGWLFAQGCRPHFCNISKGFWALHIQSGAAVAGMLDKTRGPIVWGAPDHLSDPFIQGLIAQQIQN